MDEIKKKIEIIFFFFYFPGNYSRRVCNSTGSEFVVANNLAKWKKLEPNEIDFGQDFSQKVVSRSFSAFNSLLASINFFYLLITFANSLDPDQA